MNRASNFLKLIDILQKLRAPDGCDWDREQTNESLVPYLTEETYEVIEAIENNDTQALKEELGDLLLHIVFQAELCSERGEFDIFDAIESINNKLISRHPHVFNDSNDNSWKKGSWEASKKKEKKRESVLEGVPKNLPSLLRARRIQEKAASVGFDWKKVEPIVSKVEEELTEVRDAIDRKSKEDIAMELGDLIFSIVNLARFYEIDPEGALNKSTNKFINRFNQIEKHIKNDGSSIEKSDLETMDRIWVQIKKSEKNK
tara:strand:+ start:1291 stop:2067 length:777 start_codon:yes stop_codon:yes gene_type:complete